MDDRTYVVASGYTVVLRTVRALRRIEIPSVRECARDDDRTKISKQRCPAGSKSDAHGARVRAVCRARRRRRRRAQMMVTGRPDRLDPRRVTSHTRSRPIHQ